VEYFAPFFPKNAKNRFIAMLRSYLDDSGTHTDGRSRMVVCGGILASDNQHDHLKETWATILNRKGLPFFHMHRLKAHKAEPYLSMSDADRKVLLEQLLLTMRARVRYCFAAIMPVSIYEETLTQQEKARYGNAYAWVAQMAWTMIRVWADRHDYNEPIPFVVEAGTTGEGHLDEVFNRIYANLRMRGLYRMHSLTTGSKIDFPGLQAADIVANSFYELSSYYHADGREPSSEAMTVASILKSPYMDVRQLIFNAEILRLEADALNIRYRDEIVEREK